MSANKEVTREDIQILFANLLAEEEYFDSLGQLPEAEEAVYAQIAGSRAALIRSAGAQPGVEFAARLHDDSLSILYEKLQRYACDYIKAAYLLLQELEVPAEAREFVIILLGASGGNSRQRLVITDALLAQMSGYSEKTIRTKRQAYRDWEAKAGWTVIQIHEQPRDKETRHYLPTEYEVFFADHVTEFVREWRTYYQSRLRQTPKVEAREGQPPALWGDMEEERKQTVFAESTSAEVRRQIAERVIGDRMRMSPAPPRQKTYQVQTRTPQPPKDLLAPIEAQMLELLRRARDVARQRGTGAYSWWTSFKRKAGVVLSEQTPGFPDPDEEETGL